MSAGGSGQGGTGGNGTSSCPRGSVDLLVDDFGGAAIDEQWSIQGEAGLTTVGGGRLVATLPANQASESDQGLLSKDSFELFECAISIELVAVPNQNTNNEAFFGVVAGDNGVAFFVFHNELEQSVISSEGTAPLATPNYSPSDHRFLRLREEAGTTHFETSPDGLAWNAGASLATPQFFAAVRVGFGAASHEQITEPDDAVFDNVNLP